MPFQANLIPNSSFNSPAKGVVAQDKQILTYTAIDREVDSVPKQLINLAQVEMQQVHSNEVTEVTNNLSHCVLQADAVFTIQSNLILKVKHADCLPILVNGEWIMDNGRKEKVIAVIHAGRKGTEQKITEKVCRILKNKFEIKQVNFWLGPCICEACYQVNRQIDEHYDLRTENLKQIYNNFASHEVKVTSYDKCTCHQASKYFSYRREKAGVSMNWSGIALIS